MVTSFFIATLLSAATPGENGSTKMLGSNHQHAWVEFDEKEGLNVWWDRNAKGTIIFEQQTYPVMLIRAVADITGGSALQMDGVWAVDCHASQIANLDGDFPHQQGIVEQNLTFRPWPNADGEKVKAAMREVCGKGRAE
jgi:hypothetical protein